MTRAPANPDGSIHVCPLSLGDRLSRAAELLEAASYELLEAASESERLWAPELRVTAKALVVWATTIRGWVARVG